jgi:hypothetical protein
MIKGSKGAKGHLCIIPLEGLKTLEAKPFIKVANETEARQFMTQLTNT